MNTIMNMRLNRAKTIQGLAILLVAACVTLTGCQTMTQRDMGKLVPSGNQVVLKSGGPFDARFQTDDLTVTYQYQTAGNRLKVWGTTSIRFESINELVFHLYFLNDQGKVIGIHNFYSYLDHSDFVDVPSADRHFHRDFTVPAGAAAFAVGYDGETGHDKGDDAITFSYFPFE